ncbi:MAG TPA: nucleotide disphospho-sugar-binding domain-containing protein [Solirubrobacterales bacterium]|nr:nucleotide disphospho-sugar-binding domain-containing protein [Solirubrobacterales bacterium]
MRVLVTAAPEAGHVVPLLGVSCALRDAGHEVRVATHPSVHGLIAGAGLAPVAAGLSGREVDAERLRRWPESDGQPATQWGVRMWVHVAAPPMAGDLAPVLRSWRPDFVVHEEGEYGGPVAAAAAGVPWITHGWGSPLRPAADLQALEAEAERAGLWGGSPVPPAAGLYAHGLLNPCPPFLDAGAPGAHRVWPLRPTVLGEGIPPLPPAERRTCYIGFGTVPAFAGASGAILAAARAALRLGHDVVATASEPALAESLTLLGVDVRPFVPLPDVLSRCALVVTHGGAGTTLAALASGVPVVVVPQGAPSQQRMAAAVERAGVGVQVPSGGDVEAAVAAASGNPTLRAGAAAAAARIDAMPGPAAAVRALEAVRP